MKAKIKPDQFIVSEEGKRTAVILPLKKYEELIEDLHDLGVAAERRGEPTISLKELTRRLRQNG